MAHETAEERFGRLFGGQVAESELRARTIRGGAFAMGAEGVEFVLRLGSIVLLARLLLPESFGLIAMVTAITSIAERFKDLGLSAATVQRREITHAQVSSLFWVNAGIGPLLTLAIIGLAYPIAHFYGEPRLIPVTMALGTSFLWSGLAVQHQALLRRRMQFPRIAGIQVVSTTLSIVLAVFLAAEGFGYWALVAREVSRGLFAAIGTWVCVPWLPGAPARRAGVRSMLAFGGNITGFNFANFLAMNLDQILIGKLFGSVPLGLYRQGVNLVLTPIAQLTSPVNSVAEPALSRLQADPETYRRYYVRIVGMLALLTMPLVAFLAVMADDIVLVVLGPQWTPATEFFRIFAVAVLVRPVMSTPGFVMVTQGKSRRYLWWGVISTLVLLVCILVGSRWGPVGVAYAQVASTYLLLFPVLHWGFKGTPVSLRDFASAVWRPLAASLLMGAALYTVESMFLSTLHSPAILLIATAESILFFFTALLVLPGGRSELVRAAQDLKAMLRGSASTPSPPANGTTPSTLLRRQGSLPTREHFGGRTDTDPSLTIVMACDEAYAMPLAAALRSIADSNHRSWPIDIYVLSDGFSDVARIRVVGSLPLNSVRLHWLSVNLDRMIGLATLSHVSKMTFARLLLEETLPVSLNRVLYLDSDLVVLGDLNALWQQDLQGASAGAVLDLGLDTLTRQGLVGMPDVEEYFNAGVLLIDLASWRRARVGARAIDYLTAHPKSPYADQDALNVALDGKWMKLPDQWNYQGHLSGAVSKLPVQPAVVHFVTSIKPWRHEYASPNEGLFETYRERTLFSRRPWQRLQDRMKRLWHVGKQVAKYLIGYRKRQEWRT